MIITPYEKNAKKHPKKQVEQVAASIKEFGMNQPIVVDTHGVIIVGHGRYEALKHLKWEIKDEYIKVVDLTDEQSRAYRLADNKLNESEWDMALVIEELQGLSEPMLDLTGFDSDLILEPDEKDDEVPEIPEEPISQLGDLYEIGEHRVLCGDSTKIDDVEKLMDGKKADMVFTSPPYNMALKESKSSDIKFIYKNDSDNKSSSDYIEFTKSVLENCFLSTDGFIFWNVNYNTNSKYEYIKQVEDRVEFIVEQICWKKQSVIPVRGSLQRYWEPIYVFSTNKQNLAVKEVTSNFWEVSNNGSQDKSHKACFPVSLPQRAISLVAVNSNIVLDPFLGSGSTLIAAQKTGRICYGMELDPKYIDVIITRYCQYVGDFNIKKNGIDIIWHQTEKK